MQRDLQVDRRGLATGIMGFIAMIAIIALLYTLMDPAISDVFTATSADTSDAEAQAVIDQSSTIWGYMPLYGLFLAAIFLIGRAVFESRGPGA